MFEIICCRNNDLVGETEYVSDDIAIDVFIRLCRKYIGEARTFKEDVPFRWGYHFVALSDQSGTPNSIMVMMIGLITPAIVQKTHDRLDDVFWNKCEYCGTRILIDRSKCYSCTGN